MGNSVLLCFIKQMSKRVRDWSLWIPAVNTVDLQWFWRSWYLFVFCYRIQAWKWQEQFTLYQNIPHLYVGKELNFSWKTISNRHCLLKLNAFLPFKDKSHCFDAYLICFLKLLWSSLKGAIQLFLLSQETLKNIYEGVSSCVFRFRMRVWLGLMGTSHEQWQVLMTWILI